MIEANNLTIHYQVGGEQVTALHSINLRVDEHDFMVVTGPSGSGKSTLLYTLGGLLTPNMGSVHVNGSNIYELDSRHRAKFRRDNVGFIFQTFELLPYLNALENVMLPLTLNGVGETDQVEWGKESLEKVGLGKRLKHKPSELSGGEQQRVAIARGLVNDPNILLADEPTGNLDQKTGDRIMELLSDLNLEGQAIVLVTHDHSRATVANKHVTMIDGRIISGEKRE
jgi:putative ABC transport system ATP-binding protein